MKRFTIIEWMIFIAIGSIVLAILIPGIMGVGKPKAEDKAIHLTPQHELVRQWIYMGTASHGPYKGSVYRAEDPDTKATIYVLLGEYGGIFVIPAEKKP